MKKLLYFMETCYENCQFSHCLLHTVFNNLLFFSDEDKKKKAKKKSSKATEVTM